MKPQKIVPLKAGSIIAPLKAGDIVDVIAPGSACSVDNFKAAIQWLNSRGFKPRYSPHILKPDLYVSQSDDFRFKDLKKALEAKDSKAIWCVRGGYGCLRLIPHLEKLNVKKMTPKLFIGLSDITVLHHYLNTKMGWPTLHGSVLERMGLKTLSPENEKQIIETIEGFRSLNECAKLNPLNKPAAKKGLLKGTLRGGNLATYATLCGTGLNPKYKKNEKIILFFEDITERGYKVDRMLQQIKQSANLETVQAVVFGDFTDCNEPNGKDFVTLTLKNFAEILKLPVFSGIKAGHDVYQMPLFFNTETWLYTGQNGKLVNWSPYEI